jgi:transcriptional regulator with XRE-family HTH domain
VSTSIAVRFGARLRELRKHRGWTQVRAAEEFGIDRSYISDMERGKKNVCLPTMEVLAQGFEISLAQLVRGLDRERPPDSQTGKS